MSLEGWVKMLKAEAEWKEGNTNPLEVLLDTPDMWGEKELDKALAGLEEATK